ncbi:Type 1 phosphatases regulator ypi1 [Coccidioides posadasii str. Silveira]|uniref:Type 1 phosphatases regulator n=1 Tax=Coccidioides posadasii (strain RMSCC 757 / Silveira) TaxID=443226 RepID=E9CS67_COCPS|nr:type 1 phosphatase regulator YPI1 [Coccidioides posadasii str. Silveira]QVM12244.1 Type 1 phosphatases regulator ypi1 [Coccidioides posadasii str. Silveira]
MARTRPPNPPAPSITTTHVESSNIQQTRRGIPITGTLRLRGEATATEESPAERRHIRWAEDVVDNEGQGKKSSKVCCIYHKPREVGESSSESDSSDSDSSESNSDSEIDSGEARMTNSRSPRRHLHNHDHGGSEHSGHGRKRPKTKPKVNAYERVPKYNEKREGTGKGP